MKLSEIKPNPKNPRLIKDERFELLKKSIQDFPQMLELRPIVIDENNMILGGNMRYKACKALGIKDVPVKVATGLTEAQKAEFVIKDNVSGGEWDWQVLTDEWDKVKLEEWGLEFPELEVEKIEGVEDDFDTTPPVEPKSKLGDLYKLGEHRLLCGDATKIEDVERLMDGKKADMVFTDPPYNTGMTGESQGDKTLWRGDGKKSGSTRLSHMFNDSYTDEEWSKFISDFLASYWAVMKEDCVAYICLDWRRSHELVVKAKELFHFSNLIVWDKVVHGLGSDYQYTHEFIHVFKKGKPDIDSHIGEQEYQDIWHIQRKVGRDEDHATKKPIELVTRPLQHATKSGQNVVDFFGGSGSTLIACEQTGRKCYMMEIDFSYTDVIISRWCKYTGIYDIIKNGEPYRWESKATDIS